MTTKRDSSSSSRANIPTSATIPSISDGSFEAWLKVAGCFFFFFNAWGFVNAFGAYQAYYQNSFLSQVPASTISWIGTIQAFLLVVVGIVAGPLYDLGYLRALMIIGSFLVVFGMMMLSLATKYYQVFLSQGVCVGLGSGIIYIPGIALISARFSKRRAVAIGIASSGGAVGGLIYPIVFRRLQPQLGFAWATRVLGFIALGTCILALALLLPSSFKADKPRNLFELRALKEIPFLVFSLALFFLFLGYWVPFFFGSSFASLSLHTSEDYAFYLLSIVNAGSVFGRILPAFIAEAFGAIQTLTGSAVCCGVLILVWLGIHNVAGITVFAALYGFFAGVLVSLPMAVVPSLSPSMSVIGTRIGMAWSLSAIAILIGSPIAGALANPRRDAFTGAEAWGGAVMLFGSLLLTVPWYHIRSTERKKSARR